VVLGSDVVVGRSTTGDAAGDVNAFVWTEGSGMHALRNRPGYVYDGQANTAFAINDQGNIVGQSGGEPVIWTGDGAAIQTLGTLPGGGTAGEALAINTLNMTVGDIDDGAGHTHAFLWTDAGGMQDLGTLPGYTDYRATAINDAGQVVGTATGATGTNNATGFIWDAVHGMRDLKPLLASNVTLNLNGALDINNRGQITGGADDNSIGGFARGVVLTPTPYAPTLALASSDVAPNVQSPVTLTAIVSPPTGAGATPSPTGTVVFRANGNILQTVSVASDGVATVTVTNLAIGDNIITAQYSGDANYLAVHSTTTVIEHVTEASAAQLALSGPLPQHLVTGENAVIDPTFTLSNTSTSLLRGAITARLFLATGQTIDSSAIQLPQSFKRHIQLRRGRQIKLSMRVRILPPNVPAGTYHLLVQTTDAQGNQSIAASGSLLTVDAPAIDVSGRFVHLPRAAKPGRKVTVSIAITNHGNVAISTDLDIALHASTTGVVDSAATAITVKPHRVHIQPGKSQTIVLSGLALPSVPGAYFLVAVLDPNHLLSDIDVTNNTFTSGIAIRVG
jgi:probable HAF family extracellular repeat protein